MTLPQVVERTLEFHFKQKELQARMAAAAWDSERRVRPLPATLEDFAGQLPVPRQFKRPAGVFVTLSRNGKSRGCWGSIFPEHPDLVKSTVYATVGALTREYRYAPVRRNEWRQLRPQVTVVRSIEPISGLSGQNPLRDGLMVRSGGRAAVLLPGEARDAHYQMVQCKLKAGIRPGEPCQLYSIKAEVYD